jgi:hypothetical protein
MVVPLPPTDHIVGLDLGQSSDYTALAVLERSFRHTDETLSEVIADYAVRHLRRWQLKTPYDVIIAEVVKLVASPPLDNPRLAVDQTGVGAAVVDLLRAAEPKAMLRPVLITAGHQTLPTGDEYHVPKKELVSTLQVLLQSRRLRVAPLPEGELLVKELLAFKVKITLSANETFEAWRERDHDDLVLAVALAAWLGEQEQGGLCEMKVWGSAARTEGPDGAPPHPGAAPYWDGSRWVQPGESSDDPRGHRTENQRAYDERNWRSHRGGRQHFGYRDYSQ